MKEKRTGYLGFSAQRMEMLRNGWLQARYYSDDDSVRVKDFLSYDDVYEVNPFEVGVKRRGERNAFAARSAEVVSLLDIKELLPRAFVSLSNGETRRIMLARELLKDPEVLVLDDPFNGLDPDQCARFERIIAALEAKGVEVVVNGDRPKAAAGKRNWVGKGAGTVKKGPIAVDFAAINVKIGRRWLFRNFTWRIASGERWILRGRNGSGKTTLMALITGDSPLSYGLDVTVLGQKREVGQHLELVRRKIAMVSPEMQAYLGKSAEELLEEALARKPKLLILDEPCMNLSIAESRRLCRKASEWLKRNPKVTAICIAHRPEHVPEGFDRELNLDEVNESQSSEI